MATRRCSVGPALPRDACPPTAICVHYLRELGLESEMQWATTRTGFYVDSKLHSLSNTLEFLRFPLLSLSTKSGWAQPSSMLRESRTGKRWRRFRS